MQRIVGFFQGVGREMGKVSWPKRKELTRYTITVLATVIIMTLFFSVLDIGFTALFDTIR
ncbi:preprotein translocase subunit SecE [Bacillus fonticola]|uniref:preprotein translocase subunit SecE n=1 Tax=Bacillus fonticola TaxID=2728853 RepID=UPI0014762907|nr:preprotein translocase subunit SecE [Bacillus fonticola]